MVFFRQGTSPKVSMSKPTSGSSDLKLLLSFWPLFVPFLAPAGGLVLLALLQANITLRATELGQQIIDRALHAGTSNWLGLSSENLISAVMMAALLLGASVLGVFAAQARSFIQQKFALKVQDDVLAGLIRENGEVRAGRQSGATLRAFASDGSSLAALLIFGLVGVAEHAVRAIAYSIGLMAIPDGWRILVVIAGLAIFLQVFVARAFAQSERKVNAECDDLNQRFFGKAARFFELLDRLLLFGGERRLADELNQLTRQAASRRRRSLFLSSSREALSGILAVISLPMTVILLVGAHGVSPGSIIRAQMLINLLLTSIAALCALPAAIQQFIPSLQRARVFLDIPGTPAPPPELPALIEQKRAAALHVHNLTFAFGSTGKVILHDVSLEIPAGKVVGIIGKSGSGKSTLGKVLAGELPVTSGSIRIDDVDVTDWPIFSRRKLVGYLPTGFGFLEGSLKENLLFGRTEEEINDLPGALQLSGVVAFMEEQGIGLDYPIKSLTGEGFLSFGQRRRVGIAQLLCGAQRILILDEPGASLDPETMRKIAVNLRVALKGRTAIIVTHDPDIFQTDFNVLFRDGAIADIGTHDELLQRNPAYAALLDEVAEQRQTGADSPEARQRMTDDK